MPGLLYLLSGRLLSSGELPYGVDYVIQARAVDVAVVPVDVGIEVPCGLIGPAGEVLVAGGNGDDVGQTLLLQQRQQVV